MSDWIDMQKDPQHAAREKEKARKLKKTRWWKAQVAAGICHYCGNRFPADQITMDHVVPLSRGGKSRRGNVVPCCRECNLEKKYLTPVDMILQQLRQEKSDNSE